MSSLKNDKTLTERIDIAISKEEKFNKDKMYISYFCNENNSDKTPA